MFSNQKIFIIGAAGQLGKEFSDVLEQKGISHAAPGEGGCDITDSQKLGQLITDSSATIVINCAAYNAVDLAQECGDTARAVNCDAVKGLSKFCSRENIKLVHFSSDYVFDGKKNNFYTEQDDARPLNVYGQTKLQGEQAVLEGNNQNLVFRLSWLIGNGQQNFLFKLRQWARDNPVLKISADEVSVPTFTSTVVDIVFHALSKDLRGLYHLTNSGYASRYELAKYYLQISNRSNLVIPVPMSTFKTKAQRPAFTAMSNQKLSKDLGVTIMDWQTALNEWEQRS